MKRIDFIKQLMGVGVAAALPLSLGKELQKVYLLQCFVRGFQYYAGPKLIDSMNESAKLLELRRESDNEYDKYAIALYFQNQKIGFVPKEANRILSRLMDADLLDLFAEITHIEKDAASWENLRIAVYILKETELSDKEVPVSLTEIKEPKYRSIEKREKLDKDKEKETKKALSEEEKIQKLIEDQERMERLIKAAQEEEILASRGL